VRPNKKVNISNMTYHVASFNYSNTDNFLEFCKAASLEVDQPAATNMWHDNWINENYTLPYILFKDNRFKNPKGEFFILKHDDLIIGCSGVYISDFDTQIGILGCRTWISNKYRNQSLVRDYLLPAQRDWASSRQLKCIMLTFNEYNKNIIKIWQRTRFGETREPRRPHHMFYKNFNEVAFPLTIQYTPQWAIYERLDDNFEFDWQSIALT
jgi:hypothetical protein